MSTTPNFGGNLHPFSARIANGDASNLVTLCTSAASTPVKISALLVSSTDTSARDVSFYKTIGGVDYLICTITITASAGNAAATPPINALASANWQLFEYDTAGNKVFQLEATSILKASALTTVTAAKFLNFIGDGQDFS